MKKLSICLVVAAFLASAMVPHAGATLILVQNNDGANEGFNDPTPAAPVGGNPGVTIGQQRLFAFQHAANLWAQCLLCNVTIVVGAQFNPLTCNAGSAVLGSAGTTTVHANFANAPKNNVWFSSALANCIAGADLNGATAEINAQFNSSIDNNNACLNGINWYYGIDANPPGSDIDFVTVLLHELGHGLGFQTFQSAAGAWLGGLVDTYGCLMRHEGFVPPAYPNMTNAQRGVCNVGDPNLVWDGQCGIQQALAELVAGLNNGRPRLHAPNPFQGGSSLSHWSTALTPNQLMEPFFTGPDHTAALDKQLLKDTGWTLGGTVATAISYFSLSATGRAVEVLAEFASNFGEVHVRVYRDEGNVSWPQTRVADIGHGGNDPFSYLDTDVVPGREYSYRIGVVDPDGEFMSLTERVRIPVANLLVEQNWPNPFNPVTSIRFVLPSEQLVTLTVYDANGKLVSRLVNEVKSHGEHTVEWNGTDSHGNAVGSGVYFYRLTAGGTSQSKKMVLLK